jgi:lysophospholipid acyltransferase (LPLAT)-like uncharacterized protein
LPAGDLKRFPWKKRWLIRFVGFLAPRLFNIYCKTLRFKIVGFRELDELRTSSPNFLFLMLHGHNFFGSYGCRNKDACVMTSLSADGEMLTRYLEYFGFTTVRGSSSRGGASGLKSLVSAVKVGNDCVIAADGPRGPYGKVKDGAVLISKLAGCPIVLVSASASSYWTFEKTWDKFILPKPFTKCVIKFKAPIYIDKDIKNDQIPEISRRLSEELVAFNEETDRSMRKKG